VARILVVFLVLVQCVSAVFNRLLVCPNSGISLREWNYVYLDVYDAYTCTTHI
jgi:hypothetical protein